MIATPPHTHTRPAQLVPGVWGGVWGREHEMCVIIPAFRGLPKALVSVSPDLRANRTNAVWMSGGCQKQGGVRAAFSSTRGPVVLQTEARAAWCDQKMPNFVASPPGGREKGRACVQHSGFLEMCLRTGIYLACFGELTGSWHASDAWGLLRTEESQGTCSTLDRHQRDQGTSCSLKRTRQT